MRLIVHYDQPETFIDIVEARLPDAEIRCCTSYAALPAMLDDFSPEVVYGIRFDGTPTFPRDAILACPTLGWFSVGGSGTDHLAPWDPARLTVTNAGGVAADMMAQYALGAALSFSLGLAAFERDRRDRVWRAATVAGIDRRTVAIIGLGKTGQAVARRFKAMDCRTIGVRAHPAPTEAVDQVFGVDRLADALGVADYVVVCVPLTGATRHLIDARALAAMKPGAVLVDVSRGGVVDGAALIEALRSGRIGGAALDVFETEPLPPDSPFWRLDNVIVTPHCSSVYHGWERRTAEMFCDNAARWLAGTALENIVDPVRGY
jgi:phosphoglycerate dehydrogenase-like enzyme